MTGKEDMAWPREDEPVEDEPTQPDDEQAPSTLDAELEVREALRDRPAHVKVPSDEEEDEEAVEADRRIRRQLQRQLDPIFVLMVLSAVSVGLTPMDAVVRYVILWALLGMIGVISYTLGSMKQIRPTTLDDLTAGIGFGLGAGIPFLIALGSPLSTISDRMFDVGDASGQLVDTWIFMAVAFVQPATDTLFFRGALQEFRNMFLTGGLATVWTVLFFFPHMELADAPAVALMIGLFFAFLNLVYSYVRRRNGLTAAWLCQIIAGGMVWFVPRLLF